MMSAEFHHIYFFVLLKVSDLHTMRKISLFKFVCFRDRTLKDAVEIPKLHVFMPWHEWYPFCCCLPLSVKAALNICLSFDRSMLI